MGSYIRSLNESDEPRQPGGCKLKTAPVRPVVAARPAEYVCSEDLF
ncbi:helix-turn-helix domain-containing protein, partial [Escherichia coli]